MFFIVDRPRLLRIIDIVRDDKRLGNDPKAHPYLRIEAAGDSLKLSGIRIEAEFKATVLEPGVLFLKIAVFRILLAAFTGEKALSIQVTPEKLIFGDTRLPLLAGDMLLYPDPATAPEHHPGDRLEAEEARQQAIHDARKRLEDAQNQLFAVKAELDDLLETPPTPRAHLSRRLATARRKQSPKPRKRSR